MLRGKSSQPGPSAPLLPRGIFDKETRRKTVAVAGAAMELRREVVCIKGMKRLEEPDRIRQRGR
jgi:hypothetical protein